MALFSGTSLRHDESQDPASLRSVGMLDFLEHDPRPTFVVDVSDSVIRKKNEIHPLYLNPAMASIDSGSLADPSAGRLGTLNGGKDQLTTFSRFQNWVSEASISDRPFIYSNVSWLKVLVAKRWNVICGTSIDTSVGNEKANLDAQVLGRVTSRTKVPTFDWTDELPPLKLSAHAAWARSINWAATPLGPMNTWSSQLRSICNLVMQDPRPAVVFYGSELIMIYNEAYVELLGDYHPCMSHGAREVLTDVWSLYFEPIITRNLAGETVEQTNSAIHMERSGFLEETYFSLQFIPILNSEGTTVGHYEPLVETVSSILRPSINSITPYIQSRKGARSDHV